MSLTLALSLAARPARGDSMEHVPNVYYTPPPSASPTGQVAPNAGTAASASPGVGVVPGASPTPTPIPGNTTSPAPSGSPSPSGSPGSPSPSPSASGTPTPRSFPYPAESPNQPQATLEPTPEPSPSGSPGPKVTVRADTFISDREKGTVTFKGNVKVDYDKASITAEELSVDQNANEITTDTAFTLVRPDPTQPKGQQIVTGTGMRYNYNTQEAVVNNANFSTPAQANGQIIYVRAKTIHAYGEDHVEASEATFTTCDYVLAEKVPHYHVESRSLQYFANDKLVAWDNRIYVNGRFVLWLPVVVIPLKNQQSNLNIGRDDIEGFYLRNAFNYTLPALNNGYLLNNGRAILNLFEKKGIGAGIEHYTTWGYRAATYAWLYGLVTPDRSNLIPYGTNYSGDAQNAIVAEEQALLGLNNFPFSDHQFGIDHKQRLWGSAELDGRFEDDNIYDPLTQNVRNNKQQTHLELKDTVPTFGNLNYDLGYDGSNQRGNQVPLVTQLSQLNNPNSPLSLPQTRNDQYKASAGGTVGNTQIQLSSQWQNTTNQTQQVFPNPNNPTISQYHVQQATSSDGSPFVTMTVPGTGQGTITNSLSLNSNWDSNTTSRLSVPYNVNYTVAAPAAPTAPFASAAPAPAVTVPTPSPSPWSQQAIPDFTITRNIPNIGTLNMEATKFLLLTQQPLGPNPSPSAEVGLVNSLNQFDKLPEIALNTNPILQNFQPLTAKLDYGRFFEYSSFKPTDQTQQINVNFPGNFIDRIDAESALSSKAWDLPLHSQIDFGGTGFRQFFYSTHDAQYAINERARLVDNWTKAISTSFNYSNDLTPDPKTVPAKYTNNSPFQQDRLSLTKTTTLTGEFKVAADPWFTYTLDGGYDYQNLAYNNLQSQLTWRGSLLSLPFALSLNGSFQPKQGVPYLVFTDAPLNLPNAPHIPLFGIQGQWLPISGTFTLRSTPNVFGGAYGSDHIVPGWQFDTSMGYDFNQGLWQSLNNRLYITFGDRWENHMDLVLGGYYDLTLHAYQFSTVSLNKDLHDFILSIQYDRLASTYSISLTMSAFPSQPLSFGSDAFVRRTGGFVQ